MEHSVFTLCTMPSAKLNVVMKKTKFAILICIVLIGGIVLISLWLNLQNKKVSEKKEIVSKVSTEGADAHLEKIHFMEDKHGQKTWELEAKSIQQYQDQNIMILDDVKVTFYTKEGGSVTISGKQGKVNQDSKDMELVGDVMLISSDGYQLKTHSISYHHSDKCISTPDPVEIEGEKIRLVGKGMVVDMEAKILKVLNQVKTHWIGGSKG
jgi:LPS export ABC transporter protein LptC